MSKTSHIKSPKIRYLPFLLILLSLGFFFFTLHSTLTQPHPSFLVLLPAISGLLFIILGTVIFFYLFPRAGLIPLLCFHALVANLFILFPEVQSTHRFFSYLYFLCFVFIPPTLIHFTFLISEMFFNVKKGITLYTIPYVISLLILILYFYSLLKNPSLWILINDLVFSYLVVAYLLWIGRLLWILKTPHPQLERIIARYLLIGQLLGFLLPLGIIGALWMGGISFSLNILSPLILLFPLSLLFGLVPAQRQQLQTYLVQSEKRVAFGDLLAGLAHELNNPLTFIYSTLEPLREAHQYLKEVVKQPNEKTLKIFQDLDKIVSNIEKGVSRSETLIKQFRELPSAKHRQKEEVDLEQILDKCVELLSHKWKDKIRIQKDFEKVPKITGMPGELEQAFTNLLANAFDATPEGGIVQISSHEASAGVKIVIRDTGVGIPREVVSKIFDPFFTTKSEGKGTGLGLAITLQIIKNHRGSIEVISEIGKGTEFLVFLPY
jgi:signal transduction histidine kinase